MAKKESACKGPLLNCIYASLLELLLPNTDYNKSSKKMCKKTKRKIRKQMQKFYNALAITQFPLQFAHKLLFVFLPAFYLVSLSECKTISMPQLFSRNNIISSGVAWPDCNT